MPNRLRIVIALLVFVVPVHADAEGSEKLVRAFCYAIQASAVCSELAMRGDTEPRVEQQVGGAFRGPKSPYKNDCWRGLGDAAKDEQDKVICTKAWDKYGCSGTEVKGLLQENAVGNSDAQVCRYRIP